MTTEVVAGTPESRELLRRDKDNWIVVSLRGSCDFGYIDEVGREARDKKVNPDDRNLFRWRTDHGVRLVISFPDSPFINGDTFTSNNQGFTRPVGVLRDRLPKRRYKYNVTLTKPDGETCTEDPQIIIQDTNSLLKKVAAGAVVGLAVWCAMRMAKR